MPEKTELERLIDERAAAEVRMQLAGRARDAAQETFLSASRDVSAVQDQLMAALVAEIHQRGNAMLGASKYVAS